MYIYMYSIYLPTVSKNVKLFCTKFNFTTRICSIMRIHGWKKKAPSDSRTPFSLHPFLALPCFPHCLRLSTFSKHRLSKTFPVFVIIYRLITADNAKKRALGRWRRCRPPARSCSQTLCNSGFIHYATLLAIGHSRDSRLHPHRLGN